MSDDVILGCNTPVNFTTSNPDGNSYTVSKQPSFVIVPFHDGGDREDYKRKIKEQEEQKHEETFVDKVT